MLRPQLQVILEDLKKKMVLLVGPRQAGKTTLAKKISQHYKKPVYLNYDHLPDRELIKEQSWLPETDLLILDELHKMPDWKNYLKGLYDTKLPLLHLLVTGSARLDIYDHIGDSLAGRYFRHRLLPFSLAELQQGNIHPDLDKLIERSGFPEPFFASSSIEAARWRNQYTNSILSTDVFEIDNIQNIKAFRTLLELLRYRVGSPVSYQSLAEDLCISPVTVKKYIEMLAAVYMIFIVRPYSKNIARSILKEPKIYFFDVGLVEGGSGPVFENFVALSLLKETYARQDQLAQDTSLYYLRTKDGVEVDFALTEKNSIATIVEVKVQDKNISKSLIKFKDSYAFKAIQLVHHLPHEYIHEDIFVLDAKKYLCSLYL